MHLPKVILLSECSFFSQEVLRKLKELGCGVIILSSDISGWNKVVEEKENVLAIDYLKEKDKTDNINADYIICVTTSSIYSNIDQNVLKSDREKISLTGKINKRNKAKALITYPYQQSTDLINNIKDLVDEIFDDDSFFGGAIFLGDIISASISTDDNYFLSSILKRSIHPETIFYPMTVSSAAGLLIRNLFSLRAYGKRTAILGKPVTVDVLIQDARKVRGDLDFNFLKDSELRVDMTVDEKLYSSENTQNLVDKILTNILPKKQKEIFDIPPLTLEKSNSIKKEPKRNILKWGGLIKKRKVLGVIFFRWKLKVALLISVIIFLPSFLITLAFASQVFAKKALSYGNLEIAGKFFQASEFSSKLARGYSMYLSQAGLLRTLNTAYNEISSVTIKTAQIGIKTVDLESLILDLAQRITDKSTYNPQDLSTKINLELTSLYQELGFLESEIKDASAFTQKTIGYVLGNEGVSINREKALHLSGLFNEIPELLGKNSPVTYVLIFQNNSVIRPTGGIIDSFALITFSSGKLIELKVFDTSVADRNLAGFVEPPIPLKKYFLTDSWYLKDANWDPDFPGSAEKVEWFLDKEMDVSVSGVIAVNSDFLKKTIQNLVNLNVQVINNRVTSDNFYETINQSSNFTNYPDDIINSNYRLIAENFLLELLSLDKKRKIKLGKIIVESLNSKDIQFFSNNVSVQRTISELGWDGALAKVGCQENCYADFLTIVESGKTSDAGGIKREGELLVSLEEGLVKRNLLLYFENTKNTPYSTYLRIVTPGDSGFGPIEVIGRDDKFQVSPETVGIKGYKEGGVYLEIPPKDTRALEIIWESGSSHSFANDGQYIIYVGKQSGVIPYQLSIKIKTPSSSLLTIDGVGEYNTKLSQDILLPIFWKKNE